MKIIFFWITLVLILGSCEISGEIETTNTITEETEKLVYQCADCGMTWCQQGDSLLDSPYFDLEGYENGVGTDPKRPKCINKECKSTNVTIIGEIGPDGKFIAYVY